MYSPDIPQVSIVRAFGLQSSSRSLSAGDRQSEVSTLDGYSAEGAQACEKRGTHGIQMAAWLQIIALDRDGTGSLMAFRGGARQVKWAYRPLHFLPIRLRLKGEAAADQYGVPRWNFGFSRPRNCAFASKRLPLCRNLLRWLRTLPTSRLIFFRFTARVIGNNPRNRAISEVIFGEPYFTHPIFASAKISTLGQIAFSRCEISHLR